MFVIALLACTSTEPAAPGPAPAPVPAPAPAPPPEPDAAIFGMRGTDYACAVCDTLLATPGVDVKATASSELHATKYPASNALRDLSSAWCEGAKDAGVGESIEIEFGRPLVLHGIAIYGGFFKSASLLAANGRVKTARLTSDAGIDEVVRVEDPTVAKKTDPSTGQPIDDWWDALTEAEPPWHVVRTGDERKTSTRLKLEIASVYPGAKYTDTCISRIDVMVVDPEEL